MKGNTKRMRRQAADLETVFTKDTSDKERLSAVNKELLKANSKKMNDLI